MNPEILDALLLDRALGELSPEVSALLDVHLTEHPEATQRNRVVMETISLARRATRLPAEMKLRVPDVSRLRAATNHAQSAMRRAEGLRLAACLALGLGLGLFAHTPPQGRTVTALALHRPDVDQPVAKLAPAPARFWSKTRLISEERLTRSNSPQQATYALRWDSLTKNPRLEDKL